MDFYSASEDISGQSDYLYTLDIDLSGATSPTVMDFNLAYTRYEPGNEDSLIILVSTDCGATWTKEWEDGSTTMQTAPDNTADWTPSNTEWSSETVNLDAYNGFGTVQIQFHAASGWGNNLYLDDINIFSGGGGGTAPVANFSASATTICAGSSVTFSDLSTNAPTSWSWSFGGGSPGSSSAQNQTVTYNTAGTYTVTLTATNSNGSDSQTSSITVTSNPSGSATTSNAGCGICDGSATVNGTGGSSPYAYSWNTSPIQNGATANNLCAGTYTVNITDANGCAGSTTATVGSAGGITSSATSTDAGCGGCNGTGAATGNGGTTPYAYLWSSGATTANVSNLCAGNYTVTITDNSGCSSTSTISVASGGSITATSTSSNTGCVGSCDGSATATGAGGTGPYAYTWSTSPAQNGSGATGLCAGSYTVTVTDAAGCTTTSSVTVSSGPSMGVTTSGTAASCAGECNGTATANASGGTAPFTYYWNSSPSQSNSVATGLCVGSYGVNITDANGCSTAGTVTISEPAAILLTATGFDATCGSSDGIASATATNGVAPYAYSWSTGQATAQITGLSAGVYDVTVTDATGCSTVASTSVNNAGAPLTTTSSTNVSCNGGGDATASVTATGGTTPYTYDWSNAIASTSSSVSGLSAGTYTVMVTDGSGCISTEFITILEPALLEVSMAYLKASDDQICDGSATANTSGGTGPYTYLWNDPNSQNGVTANGLCLGVISVTVTDNNGCTTLGTINVDTIVMSVGEIALDMDVTVFPNPSNGEVNIQFENIAKEQLTVHVFDLSGKLIIDEDLGAYNSNIYTMDLSRYENGIYFVRVIGHDSVVITKKISLIR